jgi:DNA helicase HerA-like ATPase
VHVPAASLVHPALVRTTDRSRPTPEAAQGVGVVIGENVYCGERSLVSLPLEDRFAHVHVIGATGTGKSTLLVNFIAQDITNGAGVAVFDPHGDHNCSTRHNQSHYRE